MVAARSEAWRLGMNNKPMASKTAQAKPTKRVSREERDIFWDPPAEISANPTMKEDAEN
jgi:hypothetical protein